MPTLSEDINLHLAKVLKKCNKKTSNALTEPHLQ
jgi:hypothetical protein